MTVQWEHILSVVQLMTTGFEDHIVKYSKLFEYQGFDAKKFSEQIFRKLYVSHGGAMKAESCDMENLNSEAFKSSITDVITLVLLFFVRGTSVVRDQKNMIEAGAEALKRISKVIDLKSRIGSNKDTPNAMVATLPRVCSAFPGHALMVLRINGNNITRPVTEDALIGYGLADYPKAWTSNVMFGILPYPSAEEMEIFGKLCKTLMFYGFLEGEIINQKDKAYPSKTIGEKFTSIDTYAKAAYTSSGAGKADRDEIFSKNYMPIPVPDECDPIVFRGARLYDNLSPLRKTDIEVGILFAKTAMKTSNKLYVGSHLRTFSEAQTKEYYDDIGEDKASVHKEMIKNILVHKAQN